MNSNPYESPRWELGQPPQIQALRPELEGPRLIAGLLSLGGYFWSLFCLPIFLIGLQHLSLPILGPGYLVTVGYLYRYFGRPAYSFRQVIWGGSALVQGAWLIWAALGMSHQAFLNPFDIVALTWWSFALVASVAALCFESPD